jgi:hypothetical protein
MALEYASSSQYGLGAVIRPHDGHTWNSTSYRSSTVARSKNVKRAPHTTQSWSCPWVASVTGTV